MTQKDSDSKPFREVHIKARQAGSLNSFFTIIKHFVNREGWIFIPMVAPDVSRAIKQLSKEQGWIVEEVIDYNRSFGHMDFPIYDELGDRFIFHSPRTPKYPGLSIKKHK